MTFQLLADHLKVLSPLVYYVGSEEDLLLEDLKGLYSGDKGPKVSVFWPGWGTQPLSQVLTTLQSGKLPGESQETHNQTVRAFCDGLKEAGTKGQILVVVDADRWLADPYFVRNLISFAVLTRTYNKSPSTILLLGATANIPPKLSSLVNVLRAPSLTEEQLRDVVSDFSSRLSAYEVNCRKVKVEEEPGLIAAMKGLTRHETLTVLGLNAAKKSQRTELGFKVTLSPEIASEYRRQRLARNPLLSLVDTEESSFDRLGGLSNLKDYASLVAASWTEEGKEAGLDYPRGLLFLGVWGCGKSQAAKALGDHWGLPVVSLDMGRMRSSAVGETENNVYQALRSIESLAPCIVWVDEAEKSFSGMESSSRSDSGTTARSLGIISTWLQETKAPVCFCLTANSLTGLPTEIVNRMDERFFFDVPDKTMMVQVLDTLLRQENLDLNSPDLLPLAEAAEGLVPREVGQAIRQAKRVAFVNKVSLVEALSVELPKKTRLTSTMAEEIEQMRAWVGYDEERSDGIRARLATPRQRKPNLKAVK